MAALGGLRLLANRIRAHRLARALADAVAADDRFVIFGRVADAFETAWPLDFSMLVSWNATGGVVEVQRGESGVSDTELVSWLLRALESESDVIVDDGTQLARRGASLALPLRRQNSALVGFLVLGGPGHPPAHVVAAARGSLDALGLALAAAPSVLRERRLAVVI